MVIKAMPDSLMPTIRRNAATGGVAIDWPDVCYCSTNGGPTNELHELQLSCVTEEDCSCPASGHIKNCPWDTCPIGQCHPMCSQVTGDDQELWCHCPCHG